jgi:hypothetical protein
VKRIPNIPIPNNPSESKNRGGTDPKPSDSSSPTSDSVNGPNEVTKDKDSDLKGRIMMAALAQASLADIELPKEAHWKKKKRT